MILLTRLLPWTLLSVIRLSFLLVIFFFRIWWVFSGLFFSLRWMILFTLMLTFFIIASSWIIRWLTLILSLLVITLSVPLIHLATLVTTCLFSRLRPPFLLFCNLTLLRHVFTLIFQTAAFVPTIVLSLLSFSHTFLSPSFKLLLSIKHLLSSITRSSRSWRCYLSSLSFHWCRKRLWISLTLALWLISWPASLLSSVWCDHIINSRIRKSNWIRFLSPSHSRLGISGSSHSSAHCCSWWSWPCCTRRIWPWWRSGRSSRWSYMILWFMRTSFRWWHEFLSRLRCFIPSNELFFATWARLKISLAHISHF